MNNRGQTETPKANELPATTGAITELNDAELHAVSGGLNPQPLPPCQRESRSM
jgi:hypothetical protein